jgi:acetyl-CoA C-acetyltransferase
MAANPVVVIGYARTPFRSTGGDALPVPAAPLGALAVDELLRRTGIEPGEVDAFYAGIGPAGEGSARSAVLASRLPPSTPALAVMRGACSGLSALGLGWKDLAGGHASVVICGGYDCTAHAPPPSTPPAAGEPAPGVTREALDEWTARSHARRARAETQGFFEAERFAVGGLADGEAGGPAAGAAFLLLATAAKAARLGVKPLARLVGYAQVAEEPALEARDPALAIRRLMKTQGRAMYEIDLLEIDEPDAAPPVASTLRLGSLDPALVAEIRERTNVHGGALALGHPPGAAGARLALTLVNALAQRGGGRGVAAACGDGGQADAVMIETP